MFPCGERVAPLGRHPLRVRSFRLPPLILTLVCGNTGQVNTPAGRRVLADLVNEFAAVRLSLDVSGNGPRLLVEDLEGGEQVFFVRWSWPASPWPPLRTVRSGCGSATTAANVDGRDNRERAPCRPGRTGHDRDVAAARRDTARAGRRGDAPPRCPPPDSGMPTSTGSWSARRRASGRTGWASASPPPPGSRICASWSTSRSRAPRPLP